MGTHFWKKVMSDYWNCAHRRIRCISSIAYQVNLASPMSSIVSLKKRQLIGFACISGLAYVASWLQSLGNAGRGRSQLDAASQLL